MLSSLLARQFRIFWGVGIVFLSLVSKSSADPPSSAPTRPTGSERPLLKFDGNRAFRIEKEFVTKFPFRHSGQPNNARAVRWIVNFMKRLGLECRLDSWTWVNYSRPTKFENGICRLRGKSDWEIVVVAHHDQSPRTIQGADNDGSGIAIMLHLAEIFAAERKKLNHSIVFLSSDGEEYGMLGTLRFIRKHPNVDKIAAGISLDNVGKVFYDGVLMVPRGQFRSYGALWLQLEAQRSARKNRLEWVPILMDWPMQMLMQMVPISFMDQGPMVARGVPAFGFAGRVPPKFTEHHWLTYHSPKDVIDYQSPRVLGNIGLATEALLRRLQERSEFPRNSGPYLYFGGDSAFTGFPLWAIFLAVIALFLAASFLLRERGRGWNQYRLPLAHFLSLWLPLIGGLLVLYLLVAVGLMDKYYLYPATSKDPAIYTPRWPAVFIFAGVLVVLYIFSRKIYWKFNSRLSPKESSLSSVKSFSFLIVAAAAVYIASINPFSLIFLLPTLFWLLISPSRSFARKALNLFLFLAGGSVVFALLYFFGFIIMRNDFAILWYLMMMLSIQMVSFVTVSFSAAVLAAGLALLVPFKNNR